MNTNWTQHAYFAALDWASDHHDVIVLDRQGAVQAEFRFAHAAAGWTEFTRQMQPFTGAPLTLETSSGPAVEQLLQRGWALYPIAPVAAARYRERKVPSGTKTDRQDTWAMADALRTDGHAWRPLRPQDGATATLRAFCRDESGLIEPRTALVNQLPAALGEYYPAALEAFDDSTAPHAWALVLQFPTPAQLQPAGQRRWEKFLHTHKLWRPETVPRRLEIFGQAAALPASTALTTAKRLLAVSLVKVLFTLQGQLDQYRQQITPAFQHHPDYAVFGSLPGAKAILGPRLLGGIGSVREEYPDAQGLRCQAGVSPVSYQSGKVAKCRLRQACDKTLRATVHLWANASRSSCGWAPAYYQHKRDEGQNAASTNGGTVQLSAGQITYAPPVGYAGPDAFAYVLNDDRGGAATGMVIVSVETGGAISLNRVFGPIVTNGDFLVRFAGLPGNTYTIEYTDSVAPVNWQKTTNLTAPTTAGSYGRGVFQFSQSAAGVGFRFYRTVYPAY